ncbi:hypothetical protein IPF37_01130 [bacterium]|nr:MAG: hypothetical protein IPF37_01130 [bacterium]
MKRLLLFLFCFQASITLWAPQAQCAASNPLADLADGLTALKGKLAELANSLDYMTNKGSFKIQAEAFAQAAALSAQAARDSATKAAEYALKDSNASEAAAAADTTATQAATEAARSLAQVAIAANAKNKTDANLAVVEAENAAKQTEEFAKKAKDHENDANEIVNPDEVIKKDLTPEAMKTFIQEIIKPVNWSDAIEKAFKEKTLQNYYKLKSTIDYIENNEIAINTAIKERTDKDTDQDKVARSHSLEQLITKNLKINLRKQLRTNLISKTDIFLEDALKAEIEKNFMKNLLNTSTIDRSNVTNWSALSPRIFKGIMKNDRPVLFKIFYENRLSLMVEVILNGLKPGENIQEDKDRVKGTTNALLKFLNVLKNYEGYENATIKVTSPHAQPSKSIFEIFFDSIRNKAKNISDITNPDYIIEKADVPESVEIPHFEKNQHEFSQQVAAIVAFFKKHGLENTDLTNPITINNQTMSREDFFDTIFELFLKPIPEFNKGTPRDHFEQLFSNNTFGFPISRPFIIKSSDSYPTAQLPITAESCQYPFIFDPVKMAILALEPLPPTPNSDKEKAIAKNALEEKGIKFNEQQFEFEWKQEWIDGERKIIPSNAWLENWIRCEEARAIYNEGIKNLQGIATPFTTIKNIFKENWQQDADAINKPEWIQNWVNTIIETIVNNYVSSKIKINHADAKSALLTSFSNLMSKKEEEQKRVEPNLLEEFTIAWRKAPEKDAKFIDEWIKQTNTMIKCCKHAETMFLKKNIPFSADLTQKFYSDFKEQYQKQFEPNISSQKAVNGHGNSKQSFLEQLTKKAKQFIGTKKQNSPDKNWNDDQWIHWTNEWIKETVRNVQQAPGPSNVHQSSMPKSDDSDKLKAAIKKAEQELKEKFDERQFRIDWQNGPKTDSWLDDWILTNVSTNEDDWS